MSYVPLVPHTQAASDDPEAAEQCLAMMLEHGVVPNRFSYYQLIDSHRRALDGAAPVMHRPVVRVRASTCVWRVVVRCTARLCGRGVTRRFARQVEQRA